MNDNDIHLAITSAVDAVHRRIDTMKGHVWGLIVLLLIPSIGGLWWLWGVSALAEGNRVTLDERTTSVGAVPRIERNQEKIAEGLNELYIGQRSIAEAVKAKLPAKKRLVTLEKEPQ